jgi:glycosyltransferase involved in cell wall biosynthesis
MMPYQILHLLGTARLEAAGIVRIVAQLAGGLNPDRYQLHAWFLGGEGPLGAELEAAGARVRMVDWRDGVRDPLGAFEFWRLLRRHRFAVVHQHYGGRSVRWLARRAMRCAIVVQLHSYVAESRGLTPVRLRVRQADRVIAVCQAIANSVTNARPRVVYPGLQVDDNDKAPAERHPGGALTVGTAGRLVPVKGIDCLLRAVSLLRPEFPNLRLEIAGTGPQQAALERQVRSLGLQGPVNFLGWRTDTEAVLKRWDVYAQPSLEDGFPVAALEAMAMGLPVVASAVGGLPELVADGQTGWLVPPGNPEALAGRLRTLLADPALRRAMGENGQARVRRNFSRDQMVASISEIYEELLGGSQLAAR